MKKHPLTAEDEELVKIAIKDIEDKFDRERHWVASAVRAKSGRVYTAINLYADSAMLSLCAEPIAIGRSADADNNDPVMTVVTVYREKRSEVPKIKVVSPCGRCREIIVDYGPDAFVILREPGDDKLFKVRATDLLPYRYEIYRQEGKLL